MKRFIAASLIISFTTSMVIVPQHSYAQESLNLPPAGSMLNLTPAYIPVLIKGLKVHPENPLLFDFILDTGKSELNINSPAFKIESQKLIKYFLASLTIKEDDLWVNLSPYEKDRMIPQQLGQTELGRDMLAQDYILKQLTASLIYPEKQLGKEFWDRVYTKARQMYGSSQVPMNTFNKVWIVADKAKVLERQNTAYVVGAHLKVMLEEDYLALQKHADVEPHSIASSIVRQIIVPELEREVNQGRNFAPLRQMFYSMILASWYKLALKDALLNQVYSNKNKTGGVLADDPAVKDKIYQQYLQAYKKGVFNYIKEDTDAFSGQNVPRKYFSGGEVFPVLRKIDRSQSATPSEIAGMVDGHLVMEAVNMTKKVDEGDQEVIPQPFFILEKTRQMPRFNAAMSIRSFIFDYLAITSVMFLFFRVYKYIAQVYLLEMAKKEVASLLQERNVTHRIERQMTLLQRLHGLDWGFYFNLRAANYYYKNARLQLMAGTRVTILLQDLNRLPDLDESDVSSLVHQIKVNIRKPLENMIPRFQKNFDKATGPNKEDLGKILALFNQIKNETVIDSAQGVGALEPIVRVEKQLIKVNLPKQNPRAQKVQDVIEEIFYQAPSRDSFNSTVEADHFWSIWSMDAILKAPKLWFKRPKVGVPDSSKGLYQQALVYLPQWLKLSDKKNGLAASAAVVILSHPEIQEFNEPVLKAQAQEVLHSWVSWFDGILKDESAASVLLKEEMLNKKINMVSFILNGAAIHLEDDTLREYSPQLLGWIFEQEYAKEKQDPLITVPMALALKPFESSLQETTISHVDEVLAPYLRHFDQDHWVDEIVKGADHQKYLLFQVGMRLRAARLSQEDFRRQMTRLLDADLDIHHAIDMMDMINIIPAVNDLDFFKDDEASKAMLSIVPGSIEINSAPFIAKELHSLKMIKNDLPVRNNKTTVLFSGDSFTYEMHIRLLGNETECVFFIGGMATPFLVRFKVTGDHLRTSPLELLAVLEKAIVFGQITEEVSREAVRLNVNLEEAYHVWSQKKRPYHFHELILAAIHARQIANGEADLATENKVSVWTATNNPIDLQTAIDFLKEKNVPKGEADNFAVSYLDGKLTGEQARFLILNAEIQKKLDWAWLMARFPELPEEGYFHFRVDPNHMQDDSQKEFYVNRDGILLYKISPGVNHLLHLIGDNALHLYGRINFTAQLYDEGKKPILDFEKIVVLEKGLVAITAYSSLPRNESMKVEEVKVINKKVNFMLKNLDVTNYLGMKTLQIELKITADPSVRMSLEERRSIAYFIYPVNLNNDFNGKDVLVTLEMIIQKISGVYLEKLNGWESLWNELTRMNKIMATRKMSKSYSWSKPTFGANAAMGAQNVGGIDLNARRMALEVDKEGGGVEMKFDPAMIAQFQQEDFSGIVPFIIRITPLESPLVLFGINSFKEN